MSGPGMENSKQVGLREWWTNLVSATADVVFWWSMLRIVKKMKVGTKVEPLLDWNLVLITSNGGLLPGEISPKEDTIEIVARATSMGQLTAQQYFMDLLAGHIENGMMLSKVEIGKDQWYAYCLVGDNDPQRYYETVGGNKSKNLTAAELGTKCSTCGCVNGAHAGDFPCNIGPVEESFTGTEGKKPELLTDAQKSFMETRKGWLEGSNNSMHSLIVKILLSISEAKETCVHADLFPLDIEASTLFYVDRLKIKILEQKLEISKINTQIIENELADLNWRAEHIDG